MIRRRRSVSVSFVGYRFPPDVILLAVRWYLRYGLSYRDVEELLAERATFVDNAQQRCRQIGGHLPRPLTARQHRVEEPSRSDQVPTPINRALGVADYALYATDGASPVDAADLEFPPEGGIAIALAPSGDLEIQAPRVARRTSDPSSSVVSRPSRRRGRRP